MTFRMELKTRDGSQVLLSWAVVTDEKHEEDGLETNLSSFFEASDFIKEAVDAMNAEQHQEK